MLTKIAFHKVEETLAGNELCFFRANGCSDSAKFHSYAETLDNVVIFTSEPIQILELFQGHESLGNIDTLKVDYTISQY
jgi:hypothetical protein